ncbi:hypothetical protein SAMN00017405_1012 [Desulfonispora thiosulfatigenes DSM 11270]|uniref:Transcription repressor NadR n=1 Tax=Desulfonispora thiosulfatigenes DSM 11270 TaxID=656914 RepID=A0A1W1UQ46_DESTI|nr:transcription repressor NadR [Desulfonispora thiosulfatigenes]SMB83217.1 hypothetical protein SAMN00017405_1012 [Desulfonispora thiosulfatigenes DSM 11270]
MAENRRVIIMDILQNSFKPVKGGDLAEKLGVSRQVIVQDIALLRAQGEEIVATPQGYFIAKSQDNSRVKKILPCIHETYEDMRKELEIIVKMGGKVLDVYIEHPLYGEIKGNLMLESIDDVNNFVDNLIEKKAEPLAVLTKGVHLHTVEAKTMDILEKIEIDLKKAELLL